jgi:endonuclease G
MLSKNWIRFAATALLLAVSALSCDPGKEGPDSLAKIETSASTSLGSAKASLFLSVTAGGAWSIELRYPSGAGGWASVSPSAGTGNKNSIVLTVQENTGDASRTLEVVLVTEGISPVLTIVQAGKSAGGSDSTGKPVNIEGHARAYHKWLELPATSESDAFDFFAHDMKGGDYYKNGGQRNWSFYYDYANRVSRWVAYPLNKALIGSGSRTNKWGYDPLIPAENQFTALNSSGGDMTYGDGSTRGHQIPSADRLNYNANVSTFYATNMTPQNYDFNSGIWADLESRVRGWASASDTLYVVTGCVLDGKTITDRGGRKVGVPSAYFKALLRYMPNSTVGFSGYMAVGFYLPHDPSIASGDCTDSKYIMSIDNLEKKTGIDFFVNLSDKISKATADKVEAEAPNAWWLK